MQRILILANFIERRYNKRLCSGRSADRLARLHGVQEAEGSNPFAPTLAQKPPCGGFLLTEQLLS